MSPILKRRLLFSASEPYRPTGSLNFHWALGKLRHDPVFTFLLEERVFPDDAQVLDLGCGRGLLAAWFLAAEHLAADGCWDRDIVAPRGLHIHGVELMEREVECANRALKPIYGDRVELCPGDLRNASLQRADVIVMLDVLHYISYADQDRLLDRIRSHLPAGKLVVVRVGDARGGVRFRLTQLVDRVAMTVQGHRLPRMWCRPLTGWISALEIRGFSVRAEPMSAGTPFANVLLISRLT